MALDIFAARRAASSANGGASVPPASATATLPPSVASTPAPAPTQTSSAAPTTQQAVPAPTVNRTLPSGAPPWGRAECGACEGKGFNSRGSVCRPCHSNANSRGAVSPDWFEVGYENGEAFWEVKKEYSEAVEKAVGSRGAGGSLRLASATEATVQPRVQAPAVTQAPSQAPPSSVFGQRAPEAPSPSPTQQVTPAATSTPGAGQSAPTSVEKQKPIKFTLLLDCAFRGSVSGVVRLDAIFAKYAALLASEEKKDSYWEINAFVRREKLAACVSKIAEAEKLHGGKYVAASTGTPDMREFAEAFAGIADEVIVGSSGR